MGYDYRKTDKRINKICARQTAVNNDELTPRKVALFITTPDMPDIKEAIKTGLISKKRTKIIAVNHCLNHRSNKYDPNIASQIKRSLTKLGFEYILVNEFFESSRGIQLILEAAQKLGKIDYAFIDLCGLATPAFCDALNRIQSSFCKKTKIAITVCTTTRNTQLIIRWKDAFSSLLENTTLQILTTPISSDWLNGLFGNFENTKIDKTRLSIQFNNVRNFLWQWQAITASLNKYSIGIQSAMQYCDLTNMGLVVFDISEKKPEHDLFQYIQKICQTAKKPVSNNDSSLTPGKKAWITRRNNQRLAKTI